MLPPPTLILLPLEVMLILRLPEIVALPPLPLVTAAVELHLGKELFRMAAANASALARLEASQLLAHKALARMAACQVRAFASRSS